MSTEDRFAAAMGVASLPGPKAATPGFGSRFALGLMRQEWVHVAPLLVLVYGVLLGGTLLGGVQFDDHRIIESIARAPDGSSLLDVALATSCPLPGQRPGLDLIATGDAPFFSSDALRTCFARPVTGLTYILDVRVLKSNGFAMHAHTLLWCLLFLMLAARVLAKWSPSKRAASVAVLVFVLHLSHAAAVPDNGARHVFVMGALLSASLLSARGFLVRGQKRHFLLAPLLFAAALGASGAALWGLIVVASFIVHPHRSGVFRVLLLSAAYVGVAAAAFVVDETYRFSGHTGTPYTPPLLAPTAYLRALPERAATLLSGAIWPVPVELLGTYDAPATHMLRYVLGATALAALSYLVVLAVRSSGARIAFYWVFLFIGALALGTVDEPRSADVVLASIPLAALVGEAWDAIIVRRRMLHAVALGLVSAPLLLPPLAGLSAWMRAAETPAVHPPLLDRQVALVAFAPNFDHVRYLPQHTRQVRREQLVYLPTDVMCTEISRVDARTLRLTARTAFVHGDEHRFAWPGGVIPFRNATPQGALTFRVVEHAGDGRPQQVDVTARRAFDVNPRSPGALTFWVYTDGHYVAQPLPEVGEVLRAGYACPDDAPATSVDGLPAQQ